MEKTIEKILISLEKKEISKEKATREILVATGINKSSTCKLDRLPKDCSIFLYTSTKSCNGCGHYTTK